MSNRKIQIKITKDTLQPTIAVIKLTKDEYTDFFDWKEENFDLFLVNDINTTELPCQICDQSMFATPNQMIKEYNMFILVNKLKLIQEEETFTFNIIKKEKEVVNLPNGHSYNPWVETKGVFLENQENNARVMVSINGNLFTRYLYSKDLLKPYYYPLIGPVGKTLIKDESDDHLHHHGLWWGHDSVNGHQLYHEFRGEGRQRHNKFISLFGGPVIGQITALIDWLSQTGERILQETRTMRIFSLPNDRRYIDIVCQLHATDGDITFSDTKEGGFPFIRVNEEINGYHTGTITSSNNDVGETKIFGKEADWVDYSGQILLSKQNENGVIKRNSAELGLSIFHHPSSDDYPAKWFVRDYGPVTSSNFHFQGGHELKSNDTYTFRQRLYIHKDNAVNAMVQKRYDEYVKPLNADLI